MVARPETVFDPTSTPPRHTTPWSWSPKPACHLTKSSLVSPAMGDLSRCLTGYVAFHNVCTPAARPPCKLPILTLDSLGTFLGDRNTPLAKPGNCTNEAGILSDYEIYQVTKNKVGVKAWYDADSDSDLVAFDGGEWVSHMSKETKARRIEYYQGLNFGGTSDWSVDLQDFST